MLTLSEKFHEQDNQIQQQFDAWTPFEQIYASVELTKKLQLSYRYFLSQLLTHYSNHQENSDMFHHTVHQANTPAFLVFLLSDPLEKIISTLQLYLPLVSTTVVNEKLLDSYRDLIIYLDSKLVNPFNFSYTEQQLVNFCQQIKFFIQANPCLQKLAIDMPQLNAIASSKTVLNTVNKDKKSLPPSSPTSPGHHQLLSHYPAIRLHQHTSPSSLMSFSSEGSPNYSFCQHLQHKTANDSGVDLFESGNLTLTSAPNTQHKHLCVNKTTSSPLSEHTLLIQPSLTPLSAVLSTPVQSMNSCHSELHCSNSNHQQQEQRQVSSKFPINEENEGRPRPEEDFMGNNRQLLPNSIHNINLVPNTIDNRNRLRQFCSLRNRDKTNNLNSSRNDTETVSEYLAIDGNSGSVRNTFILPNSGMRDVPKWLKMLRLHKYALFFSQLTYDQMMNLTFEQLKESKITDGACSKILLNVKKLKERETLVKQCLTDMDNGQADVKTVLQQLNELMLTPIRGKHAEQVNDNDGDLPNLIMQVLEKVYQQLSCNNSSANSLSDMCNQLLGLFDRCYKHEAFSVEQRHTLLHWRGPLCNKLQQSGRLEYKSMQSSALNRRMQLKPQSSIGTINSIQINKPPVRNVKSTLPYHSSSIPLSKQCKTESLNQDAINNYNNNSTDLNVIRRPMKSPTFISTLKKNTNEDTKTSTDLLSIVTTPLLNEQLLMNHQTSSTTKCSGNATGLLHPSCDHLKLTPPLNNEVYLASNQHQLSTRTISNNLYDETNSDGKTKLCKIFSDPNRIPFYNLIQNENLQSSNHSQVSCRSTTCCMAPIPPLSHSPSTSNNSINQLDLKLNHVESTIQKTCPDTTSTVYYGNDNINSTIPSPLNDNNTHDTQHTYNYQDHNAEFETFYRQITEDAMNNNTDDTSIYHKDNCLNLNNSTNTEL